MRASNTLILALLLIPLTFAAYLPATFAGFIWDDDSYVTENATLRSTDGLWRIWFEVQATPQYYPLVHTSYWLEYRLWELNAAGYHIINILLHSLNAVLLYLLLRRLRVPAAWLAAAVFALHPVHVESVAWISERKNVLSGLFYLASALCWLGPGQGVRGRGLYLLALLFFGCAMLSKTVTATLPAALLLIAWWQTGRITWKDALALLPMFILGIALGLLTVWLEKEHVGARGPEWDLSFVERCLIAGRAVWFYLWKLLWPTNLAFIYPRWHIDATASWQYLFPAAALALIGTLWHWRQRLGRGPLVAFLFFGGTLFPALGFFNIYPMVYSFVANHFQYLASIGPIVLFTACAATVLARAQVHRLARVYPAILVLACLGAVTWINCLSYLNAETLWVDTLRLNPDCWMAHNNLGVIHEKRGEAELLAGNSTAAADEFQVALAHYLRAVSIYPRDADVWHNLGIMSIRQQKYKEAIRLFAEAVDINPNAARSLENLGLAYYLDQQYGPALDTFEICLNLQPDRPATHKSLGMVLAKLGKTREAVAHLQEALRLDPAYEEARRLLEQITQPPKKE